MLTSFPVFSSRLPQLLCAPSKARGHLLLTCMFSGNLPLIFKKLFMDICKEDIICNSNYLKMFLITYLCFSGLFDSGAYALHFWLIFFEAEPLYLRLTCNLLGSPDPPWTFSISPVSDSWTLELLMCIYMPRSCWCTYYTYYLIYNTPLYLYFFICNHCLDFCWTWASNIYLFVSV